MNRLHDSSDLREDLLRPLGTDPAEAAAELRRHGAPAVCYAIGGPHHGQEHNLVEAPSSFAMLTVER